MNAADKENDYLLSLSSEKFLYCFYQVAGLTTDNRPGYQGGREIQEITSRTYVRTLYVSPVQAYLSCSDSATKKN